MKLQGKKVSGPKIEEIYVETVEGPVMLIVRPLGSDDNFEEVMPSPRPPARQLPSGELLYDNEDKNFTQSILNYSKYKVAWQVIRSLDRTPGLEFDTVNMSDPLTWENVYKEIEDSLGDKTMKRILTAFGKVNVLDDDQIEEAKKSFLALRELPQ